METARKRMWLRAGALLFAGFGVMSSLGSYLPLNAPLMLLADGLFWPLDGAQTGGADETRLLAGILGGVSLGFAWMIWQVSGPLLEERPDDVRRIVLGGAVIWFVVDGIGSWASGAPLNIAANLTLFVALSAQFLVNKNSTQ